MSVTLPALLQCRDDEDFAAKLKLAITQLPSGSLPLHQATTQGGLVDESNLAVTVLQTQHKTDGTIARIGVFFEEMVGGCNCHDDPIRANGYCTIEVSLNQTNGDVSFCLIND